MSFAEERLELGFAYGCVGGPEFFVNCLENSRGQEQRVIQHRFPRHRYSFGRSEQKPINGSEMDALRLFQINRRGSSQGFRFKDWNDYYTPFTNIGTGNGGEVLFQLQKRYVWNGNGITRVITKPVTGTVQVRINGVQQSSGFSVNFTTGVVIFASPPSNGAVITAACEFDVPVRFENDELNFKYLKELNGYSLYTLENFNLIETKEPARYYPNQTIPPQDINAQINLGYDFGTIGGNTYDTEILSVNPGFETRFSNRTISRAAFNVAARRMTFPEKEALLNQFWVCRGAGVSFRYLDRKTNTVRRVRFKENYLPFRFDNGRGPETEWLFNQDGFGLIECV